MIRSILTCLVILLGAARAAEVHAELSTDTVEAGQGALLSLKIEGGSPEAHPQFPAVKNLIVNSRGQSQQVQIINGKVSRSLAYNYAVGSQEPGEYEIPAITVRIAGQELSTQPLKLTVKPSASAAPKGMANGDEASPTEKDQYGFLTFQPMVKDRKHLYPGEIAPVRIRAYFPIDAASVQLNGSPHPESTAFTLHNLTQEPQQTAEQVKDKQYRVITWYAGLSATKAGSYPASFVLNGMVGVRDRSARPGGSMMDDFFAPVIQKEVSLSTPDPAEVEVKELPAEGRPDDFSGAIGQFEFESVKIPEALKTGEPCQIEARVEGSGNFALLKEPHPVPATDWKLYDGSGDFTPSDAASFSGSKTFRYSAVPQVPGDLEMKLAFSYFDPEAGEYRTVESTPRKVVISGERTAPAQATEATVSPQTEPSAPQLAPLSKDLGSAGSYQPLSEEAWFYPLISGFGAVALALAGYGIWTRRGPDLEKAARQAGEVAVRSALSAAGDAARAGDGLAFFTAAREALRIRLAERSGIRPEAVTLADLRETGDDDVVRILKEADRLDYSGRSADAGDLNAWNDALRRGVERLAATPETA